MADFKDSGSFVFHFESLVLKGVFDCDYCLE